MLILTRKVDEKIIVDEDIVITIVEIRGDRVKLGFDAPHDIAIHRQEIWIQFNEENEEAGIPHMDG